jgi:hypothetical protein
VQVISVTANEFAELALLPCKYVIHWTRVKDDSTAEIENRVEVFDVSNAMSHDDPSLCRQQTLMSKHMVNDMARYMGIKCSEDVIQKDEVCARVYRSG